VKLAILRLVRSPGDYEIYDTVVADMRLHSQHPLGLIMHGASVVDGQMQIVQVWDALEYAERFERDILGPALEANDAPQDREIEIFELHDLVTP
jgi:hypothetical protein